MSQRVEKIGDAIKLENGIPEKRTSINLVSPAGQLQPLHLPHLFRPRPLPNNRQILQDSTIQLTTTAASRRFVYVPEDGYSPVNPEDCSSGIVPEILPRDDTLANYTFGGGAVPILR